MEATIVDLSHDGRGVARIDDKAVFVHNALPGERVRLTYTSQRRNFDQGTAIEILEPSPDRVAPRCPHFGTCGGCAMQHLAAPAQLAAKHKVLVDSLQRIGGVAPDRWLDPLSAGAWGYRRKARLSVRNVPKKGRVLVGFRERNGRYVCDMRECHTLIPEVGFALEALSDLVGALSSPASIPQIEIAAGDHQIVLLIRHLEPLTEADRSALGRFGQSHGLSIYLQSGGPQSVAPLGDPVQLEFRLDEQGLDFTFSPHNFVQVNARMNQLMVSSAVALLEPQAGETVLDLFCGLGNFTLPLAQRAGRVIGVEGEPSLIELARHNAARNGIENATFVTADLTEDVSAADWLSGGADRILLDPPRSGAAEMMAPLAALQARRIVYVSCHPGSLARDAGVLVGSGYRLEAAGILDMFPHTAHVESIAVFGAAG